MNSNKFWEIANYVFFSLVIVACLVLTIVLHLDWLAFVTCSTNILYFVFLSDKNILNYSVGLISSATYIVIAYNSKLYGEMVYYLAIDIPMAIIAFILWLKHRETALRVETRKMSFKWLIITFVCSSACVVAGAFILKAVGGSNVWLDSMVVVISFVASILMMLRFREQWFMWILLYVVAVILWSINFDLLMLIMSASALLSSVIGFVVWYNKNRNKVIINQ